MFRPSEYEVLLITLKLHPVSSAETIPSNNFKKQWSEDRTAYFSPLNIVL
jgi:hypothetical protein